MGVPGLSFEIVRDSTPILGLRSDRTAMIALTERGPVEQPVLVHSYDELVEQFGCAMDGALGVLTARGYFDNGGEELLVARFVPKAAATAAATPLLTVGVTQAAFAVPIEAASPGAFGNNIRVDVVVSVLRRGSANLGQPSSTITFAVPTFSVAEVGMPVRVYLDGATQGWGTIIDATTTSVSVAPPVGVAKALFEVYEPTFSLRIQEPGRAESSVAGLDLRTLDVAREKLAGTAITISAGAASATDVELPVLGQRLSFSGGADGLDSMGGTAEEALAESFRRCVRALELSDIPDVVVAPDLWSRVYVTKGKDMLGFSAAMAITLADELAESASRTRDRVVILDPPLLEGASLRPAAVPELVTWCEGRRNALLDARDFAATFAPWVRIIAGGRYRGDETLLVPPSAYVAGRLARTARERGAWIATGNVPLEHIVGLSARLSIADQEALQALGVSPLRMEVPRGATIQGVRSLAWPDRSAWGFLSTRRLFNYLRRALKPIGLSYAFEPNAPETWMALRRDVTRFLRDLFDRGAFAGAQPNEAFFVEIDDTLTPEDARDNGTMTAQIGVAPTTPLEFLVVRLLLQGGNARVAEEAA